MTPPAPRRGTDIRFRAWNLLLLIPLVSIVTPLFNSDGPRLGGLPFFYWFQLLVIPIGIVCTVTVHLMTRHVDEEGETKRRGARPDEGETQRSEEHADRGARPGEGTEG